MPYDAVIIGGGPSGLAAAMRLAYFGVKVCLLEAHYRLGGLNSWHSVNGKEISTGLHALTNYSPDGKGGPLGKLLRQLRMKFSDLELRAQGRSSIRFPSATLSFTNDTELLRQQVAAVFPGEIDGFDQLRKFIRATDEGELTSLQTSARDVLERHLKNPLLVDMLLCPVMYYGNPGGVGDGRDNERDRPDMDWLLFCVLWKSIFETGLAYPAHGMRPIWEGMARRIREDGGDIRLSCPVVELPTVGGRVAAARLANGEEVTGKYFFSSAGGVETDRLLGPAAGPAKPIGTMSAVEGICLLDCLPLDAGMADTALFYSFEDRLVFRCPQGLVEDSSGLICATGNYLPTEPGDTSVLKISQQASYPAWKALRPEAYQFAKDDVGAGMAAALGKLGIVPVKAKEYPGKYAIFDDMFTPLTLQRYAHHAEAAIYGSPVKSRDGATACPNLFLIGADQGFHGIVGAMLSGVAMANIHLLAKH